MATNIQIEALGQANMPDNNEGFITPAKMRELFGAMLDHLGGNIYLANSSTTKQTVVASTPLTLTNDGASPLSVTTYRPHYLNVATFWDGSKIHFDEIQVGSIMFLRIEMGLNIPANSTTTIAAVFKDSEGSEAFRLAFVNRYFKSANTNVSETYNIEFFMDTNIENGTMELVYNSDSNGGAILKSLMVDIR
jgi:hypothetical protein